ncbi:lysine exporter LysO family protein [uncultured Duncaniella sp.]|uniref:lysine exporter LysO family protein n=1 Tax=uncultured Duncaniella sp. TaxID=2768039 RepID=UPI0025AA01C1|nr:lysine exporter LysO family protein [uncultured Duncaniella sp.]
MKGSLIIVGFFVIGILCGYTGLVDIGSFGFDISFVALAMLIFFVGIGIGHNIFGLKKNLRTLSPGILFLPFVTIIGTLAGVLAVSFFIPSRSISEVLAVGSGFGYYSLSSILITDTKGAELGVIALLANICREIITLLGAPLLCRLFGPLAPISSGGATSMDTTLPIITAVSGNKFAVLSVYHGFVVDLSVPLLVSLFCSL